MNIFKIICMLLLILVFACSKNTGTGNVTTQPQETPSSSISDNSDSSSSIDFESNAVIYFDFDKSIIKDTEKEKLMAQVKWLQQNSFDSIIIEGHTDAVGTREYNLALGERRSNAIREFFIKEGIPNSKIKVVSYGKEQLIDTVSAAPNRRTITKVQ